MLNLDSLANWESAVLASIRGATGSIEQRDAQITRSGMYAEYPAIVSAYAELTTSDKPPVRLEALKRAVFLVWYSFNAVSVDSGISELAESTVREIMGTLDSLLTHGEGDDELRAMLAWYRDSLGYPFEYYGPVRALDPFIRDVTIDDARTKLRQSHFACRGQLGVYWTQLLSA